LRGGLIDSSDIAHISSEAHRAESKTALVFGDLVLSKTAYPAASFVNLDRCNVSQDTIAVRLSGEGKKEFSSAYIGAFLNCRYGVAFMGRHFQGNVQAHLSLPDGKKIAVPKFSPLFQETVDEAVLGADTKLNAALRELERATSVLDATLGFSDWHPPEPLTYTRSASEVLSLGRMDAQHFQPKYAALISKMREHGEVIRLGDVLAFCDRGRQPNYSEIGLPVVNSRHVRVGEVVVGEGNRLALEEAGQLGLPEEKRLTIRNGDVLMNGTGVGTLGRCAPYLHEGKALPDNHVTILRMNADAHPILYLLPFN
jgi:type I restriction enzyme M protein